MRLDYASSYKNKCVCFVLVPVYSYSMLVESETKVTVKLTLAMHDVVNVNLFDE